MESVQRVASPTTPLEFDDCAFFEKSTPPAKRSVQFAALSEYTTIISRYEMTEEEYHFRWYTPEQIDGFKENVRAVSRELRHVNRSNNMMMGVKRKRGEQPVWADSAPTAEVPRGLEQRVSVERQRNKYVTIQAVLECQRQLSEQMVRRRSDVLGCAPPPPTSSAEELEAAASLLLKAIPPTAVEMDENARHLKSVSARCSRMARCISRDVGVSDFCSAYPAVAAALLEEKARRAQQLEQEALWVNTSSDDDSSNNSASADDDCSSCSSDEDDADSLSGPYLSARKKRCLPSVIKLEASQDVFAPTPVEFMQ